VSAGLTFTILGCGSSGGVPRADGNWGDCDPAEPKNRRMRCALLVRRGVGEAATTVMIDTSPDFRVQCQAAHVTHLDAVLYTHDHADQTHGIDDVRAFFLHRRQRIPAWMDQATQDSLLRRFGYIFEATGGYPAIMDPCLIPPHGHVWSIDGPGGEIPVTTFDLEHGEVRSVGYRIGDVAYTPDVGIIPDSSFDALRNLDLWIVDALRWTTHPSHAHVEQTLEWIKRVQPRRAVLTNMHIDIDYNDISVKIPANVIAAFDGLTISTTPG
jgi:phosphoribosyl 1,2-cyclic phosphate phosphodiesterase